MTLVKESIITTPFFDNLEVDETFDVSEQQKNIRNQANEALQNLVFPTTRNEYWKYTRLGKITKTPFKQGVSSSETFQDFDIEGLSSQKMVFENGHFRAGLSEKTDDNEIKVLPLSEAKVKYPELVDKYIGQLTNFSQHTFSAININYYTDGLFVYVPKNKTLNKTIECRLVSTGLETTSNIKNIVVLEQGAQAEIMFREYGNGESGFINQTSEIWVGENAHLKTYQAQNFKGNSQVNTIDTKLQQSASYKNWLITKSGKLVRNNLNITLKGENGNAEIYGVYIPKNKEVVDNHTYIDHAVPNCLSNELYRGIIDDAAVATFNGKVMVRQHAQKTNAFQVNNNILLSDNSTINSKPELEIFADDVKCSHGSTTGQMDEEAIFYLRSRGVERKKAINLMVQAFAHDAVGAIENEAIKAYFNNSIDERFA